MPSCPAPTDATYGSLQSTLNTARSTLCVYRSSYAVVTNWGFGVADCGTFVGAGSHMCSMEEVRRACYNGMTLITNTWMADRTADNEAVYVNNVNCSDFDGVANGNSTNLQGAYCCMEYPKY